MSGAFEVGEQVLLVDRRGRNYLVTLRAGGTFHTHSGSVGHDSIIGRDGGTRLETSSGMVLTAFRPRFADFVLKMRRGAQVVYPKDLGPAIVYGDVFPGARVLEAGSGSGALTIALCRAVGSQGSVVSYEVRQEHIEQARENVIAYHGGMPPFLQLRTGDVAEVAGMGERFDRCLLDLPEPWGVLPTLREVLEPGGVLCAYLPTTGQVQQLVLELVPQGFLHIETFETIRRGWHVTERSVRPDHRMVGHTGFLTVARLCAERPGDT